MGSSYPKAAKEGEATREGTEEKDRPKNHGL